MNNIGLKQNIEHLEKEYERFKKQVIVVIFVIVKIV